MSSFCENCGNPLQAGEVCKCQQPVRQETQRTEEENIHLADIPNASPYGGAGGASLNNERPKENPAVEVVKGMASSPLFLTACILMGLQIIVSILYPMLAKAQYNEIYSSIFESPAYANFSMGNLVTIISTFVFIGMIPYILINIGMWMVYAYGKNNMDYSMRTGGLTLIKVICIIYICLISLASILFLIGFILGASSGLFNSIGITQNYIQTILGIVIFTLLFMLAIVITYYTAVLRTINTIKNTILTGIPSSKVSGYLAVMNFIFAFFTFISLFPALIKGDVFTALSSICSAALFIVLGICIFQYKGKMEDVISRDVKFL